MPSAKTTTTIDLDYKETLTDVVIDTFQFKASWSPLCKTTCILWFRDTRVSETFEALGQFSTFDKRTVLFFISRYVTNATLREEIDSLRFKRRIEGLSPTFFREIECMCARDKGKAYRHLFNLDDQMNNLSLSDRRRIMARKFHPDAGGDSATMSLINQAHDFLAGASPEKPTQQ